jgi:hypothetical protein
LKYIDIRLIFLFNWENVYYHCLFQATNVSFRAILYIAFLRPPLMNDTEKSSGIFYLPLCGDNVSGNIRHAVRDFPRAM